MSTGPNTGAKRLREMLKDKNKIVVCPGVYDGLTSRIAISQGFDALYMVKSNTSVLRDIQADKTHTKTGSGTSMSRLGWADLGMATLTDMTANAEMIANLYTSVPLISYADTGYGGPIMVSRTVANYARAGVAALHIEDQVSPISSLRHKVPNMRTRFKRRGAASCKVKTSLHEKCGIVASAPPSMLGTKCSLILLLSVELMQGRSLALTKPSSG